MNWTLILLLLLPGGIFVIFALALCSAAKTADKAITQALEGMRKRNITLPVILLILLGLCVPSRAQSLPDAPTPQYTTTTVHNTPVFREHEQQSSRHPRRLVALLAVNAFAVVGDLKDIRTSEECFKQLGDVEANTWLVGLHPTPGAYYRRDFGLLLPLLNVVPVMGYVFRRPEVFFMGLTGPVAFGAKHLKQGYDNERLLP